MEQFMNNEERRQISIILGTTERFNIRGVLKRAMSVLPLSCQYELAVLFVEHMAGRINIREDIRALLLESTLAVSDFVAGKASGACVAVSRDRLYTAWNTLQTSDKLPSLACEAVNRLIVLVCFDYLRDANRIFPQSQGVTAYDVADQSSIAVAREGYRAAIESGLADKIAHQRAREASRSETEWQINRIEDYIRE